MPTAVLLALLPLVGGQKPYPLRVNVAERQEFDYDLTLPGRPRPLRILYTVDRISQRGPKRLYQWRVRQYERDERGRSNTTPVYEATIEADDRNLVEKAARPAVDRASFGASEKAKQVASLVIENLSLTYPANPPKVDKVWRRKRANPLVKGESYTVDYKMVEELTVRSWNCYGIGFASSIPIGYGGKELSIEGTGIVERSTGMPVTVDLRVTGADAVSESLNRSFRVHLTRDRDER